MKKVSLAMVNQALGVALISAGIFGSQLCFAQLEPARRWPQHEYWTVGLLQDPSTPLPYCSIHTSNHPANTLEFEMVQNRQEKTIVFRSSNQQHEVKAITIDFASDGFRVLSVPVKSVYQRDLYGRMSNSAAGNLDAAQWDNIWRVFKTSGVVTVSTSFVDSQMSTQGFAEAERDFQSCLGQLDLIHAAPGGGG